MTVFTQLFSSLNIPFVLYFAITAILKRLLPKRLYICSIDPQTSKYTSLLPIDYYTKPQQPGNNDGGYVCPSDSVLVLEQLRTVVSTLHSQKALKSLDPYNLVEIHERLGYTNSNDVVNWFTVQFNLFAGSVSALGTDTHAELVQDARNMKKLGCFALTEKAAGFDLNDLVLQFQ